MRRMKTYQNSFCKGWTSLTSEVVCLEEYLVRFELALFLCVCSPPFTIQRVCELVMGPRQHYKRRDKYMRAMEKVKIEGKLR